MPKMSTNLALALAVTTTLALAAGCDRRSGGLAGPEPVEDPTPVGPQELAVVGFYNVENLFDVSDDPDNEGDDEYLPSAAKRWDRARYDKKVDDLARVISELGAEAQPGGPALLGLSEVENARVLEDLVSSDALADSDYGVVHFDSPDYRGIDVALLYRRADFDVLEARPVGLVLPPRPGSSRERTTRDILYVKGLLRGDTLHYLVNHWPSRGGGEVESRPDRARVAGTVRILIDSIRAAQPDADVAVAGDLNDDPIDASVAEVLGSVDRRDLATADLLYNPYVALFRQGRGTLGYRRAWNLFDQILLSRGLAAHGADWSVRDAQIFAPGYLLQVAGSYRGFPDRTYVGDDYRGGVSDHLPVFVVLTRPL